MFQEIPLDSAVDMVEKLASKRVDLEEKKDERENKILENPNISDDVKKTIVRASHFQTIVITGFGSAVVCYMAKCGKEAFQCYAKECTKQMALNTVREGVAKIGFHIPGLIGRALSK